VLTDVFQFHVPPIRRLPSILWNRIQNDLQEYLVVREADSTKVMAWYHRQFIERCQSTYNPLHKDSYDASKAAAKQNFNNDSKTSQHMTTLFKEYFKGVWADKEKPFNYSDYQAQKLGLSTTESSAKRYVAKQPTILKMTLQNRIVTRINERKVSELGHLIFKIYRNDEDDDAALQECISTLFYNLEYLYAMVKLDRLKQLYSMLSNLRLAISDDEHMLGMAKREAFLMARAVGSDIALLTERPEAAIILLSNQFVPFYNLLPNVTQLIDQVDSTGRELCALVAPHQQVDTGGGHAFFKIMNHIGPVTDFMFATFGYMYSVSEKIIGFGITENGVRLFLNKRPLELPLGHHFTLIRSPLQYITIEMDSSDDEADVPHGRNWQALYLATSHSPNLYMYDNWDGKLLGTLDVEHDVPSIKPSAHVKGMEFITEEDTDTVVVFIWYDTKQIVIYEAHTRHLLLYEEMHDDIITLLQEEEDKDSDGRDENNTRKILIVGFLTESGLISGFRVIMAGAGNPNDEEAKPLICSIQRQFDVHLPVSTRLVAFPEHQDIPDNSLLYATDDCKVNWSFNVQLKEPIVALEVTQQPNAADSMPSAIRNTSLVKKKPFMIRNSSLQLNSSIKLLSYNKDGPQNLLLACTEEQLFLIRIDITSNGHDDVTFQITKTVKRHYEAIFLVDGPFIFGYNGSKVDGLLVTPDGEDKMKINQAFSFNAHRLPITKMEVTEGTLRSCIT
jgi:hypothetical protein